MSSRKYPAKGAQAKRKADGLMASGVCEQPDDGPGRGALAEKKMRRARCYMTSSNSQRDRELMSTSSAKWKVACRGDCDCCAVRGVGLYARGYERWGVDARRAMWRPQRDSNLPAQGGPGRKRTPGENDGAAAARAARWARMNICPNHCGRSRFRMGVRSHAG